MSDDALFDVFDQDEPSAVVDLPTNVQTVEQIPPPPPTTTTTTVM